MALTEQLMDADTFLARPPSSWPREELIDGRIVVSEPTWRHQHATTRIIVAISRWIEERGRGAVTPPVDLRISDRNVLAPDVVWYADVARTEPDASAQLEPPDLAVEVRSPSTWRYDVGRKRELYEAWGVGELWLVDGDARVVNVHRRSNRDATAFDVTFELGEREALTSPLLPGFALAVADVFALPGEHQK